MANSNVSRFPLFFSLFPALHKVGLCGMPEPQRVDVRRHLPPVVACVICAFSFCVWLSGGAVDASALLHVTSVGGVADSLGGASAPLSPAVSLSSSASPLESPTPSPSPSPTSSEVPSPSGTPSATPSPTVSPSATPSPALPWGPCALGELACPFNVTIALPLLSQPCPEGCSPPGADLAGAAPAPLRCGDCGGNFALPSGRRLHAYANVLASTVDLQSRWRRVTLRSASAVEPELRPPATPPAHIYLCVEQRYHEQAFIHWLSEMGTWVAELWEELKVLHPRRANGSPALQLLLAHPRGFKPSMLRELGVAEDEVVYYSGVPTEDHLLSEAETGGVLTDAHAFPHSLEGNLVYFPPLLDFTSPLSLNMFQGMYHRLVQRVRANAGLAWCSPARSSNAFGEDLAVLCIGRRSGNFADNEWVHFQHLNAFCETLRSIFGPLVTVAFMEDLAIADEARLLDTARVIVTNYGSGMFFQGALARNASVLILGACMQHESMPSGSVMWREATDYNEMLLFCTNAGLLPPEVVQGAVEARVTAFIASVWESRSRLERTCTPV